MFDIRAKNSLDIPGQKVGQHLPIDVFIIIELEGRCHLAFDLMVEFGLPILHLLDRT